ncbi:hypothetical protein ERICIV_04622 (plasmid) [Paenibacillus larvae subsp. larvae]|uniref:Uncharacterized protein n=2 Tax=Paenibacillus larvae TaxID=1464 RepID=A0A2L1UKC2_9BACL|nr:hypothetical protein [Paenibacillus larvae]AQT87042.1 hypothetical protein B1222_23720 [Paenibacillus larvae subsp. pulvifaciens]AQZ49360.1 hypothetical protein B5S25_22925 [Paenibacillus larvae subsp. pulvifaciens]AVF29004.1 hypothetical protein ERICIII_05003 [Paenibacillus larvae subsp. larvae]AVF33385.1 hypothetical protein ERICIV_04622 [Paenibacillus larvae subsp. larvae]MBH0341157.1 hypothetical protein [Paenibacillus larvae]
MTINVNVFKTKVDGWKLKEVDYPLLQALTNEEFTREVEKLVEDECYCRFHLELYENEYFEKVARFTAVPSSFGVAIILVYTKKSEETCDKEEITRNIINLDDVRTIYSMMNNKTGVIKSKFV